MLAEGARVRNVGRYRSLAETGTVVMVNGGYYMVTWDKGGWASGLTDDDLEEI